MNFLLDVSIQGLLYSVLTMGVAVTFKVLKTADLTVDGSFPLGAVVATMSLLQGVPIVGALLLAFGAGWLAGAFTSRLQRLLNIQPLLSGILTMSALYTINLFIAQNRSNLPLFQIATLFTRPNWVSVAWTRGYHLGILVLLVLAIKLSLDWFLSTKKGLMLRVAGDNPTLVNGLGEALGSYQSLGLSLANALVALCGALVVMMTRFYDLSMGFGIVVVALASVALGDALLKRSGLKITTAAIFGSWIYRLSIATALALRLHPSALRLVTVLMFIFALTLQPEPLRALIKGFKKGGPYARS
jgi:putative ABC transport system permease protein